MIMIRCRCGHPRDMHEHFRDGTDCGYCDCQYFSPAARPGLLAGVVTVLGVLIALVVLAGVATAARGPHTRCTAPGSEPPAVIACHSQGMWHR